MSDIRKEIQRRRTFAIISHPDAGKTTLTEKLLLYGGAIQLAGSVKGKATARHAVSDWMELEKQRGISISSSVMQFEYNGYCINILDTPGHQDFSEDTYRTLMAADSAVMVIDAAKGIEPQTRKLFKICAMRNIPIFTFINKLDREARSPYDLMEELEQEQARCKQGLEDCETYLRQAASHLPSIQSQMLKAQNDAEYSAVSNTSQSQDGLVWLTGYIPAAEVEGFKKAAAQAHWAWAMEDPAADDDKVPTKVKYNKVTRLMIPVFDILGVVPGYR